MLLGLGLPVAFDVNERPVLNLSALDAPFEQALENSAQRPQRFQIADREGGAG